MLETYKIPLLEAFQRHNEYPNAKNFLGFEPNDFPYVNFNLKWMDIVLRVDCMNDLIYKIYSDFKTFESSTNSDFTENPKAHSLERFNIEQLVYWLRKTADEIIGLIYTLNYRKQKGYNPTKIKICSIGDYLRKETKELNPLSNFKELFYILNEISNGYKHSFYNSEAIVFKAIDYPIVFAIPLFYNDFTKEAKLHSPKLENILNEYNNFLAEVKMTLINEYGCKTS